MSLNARPNLQTRFINYMSKALVNFSVLAKCIVLLAGPRVPNVGLVPFLKTQLPCSACPPNVSRAMNRVHGDTDKSKASHFYFTGC